MGGEPSARGSMKSLADEDLGPLISMVAEDRGMDLTKYKNKYLRRRIGVRLRASGAHNLNHYLKLMKQEPAEYQAFIDTITINTSSFFRNPGCFDVIARQVMPSVASMAAFPARRPPYIWSVGCSRGEEAYSLAILASPFPSLADIPKPAILATDIDRSILEEARSGVYGARALSELSPEMVGASFTRIGPRYQVAAKLKGMVNFARHDILADDPPGRFLLILCRNLMIYLEKEAQELLIQRLAQALHPGGYLVLGKSEILIGGARGRLTAVSAAERIYRESSGGDLPSEPSS